MTQTLARIKQKGKNFEVIVDMDRAVKFKKGSSNSDFLEIETIFSDSKKGFKASESELMKCFGTEDADAIAQKIVKSGEILVTQEHREEEKDKKYRRVVDFLARNSIDSRTGNPITPERIKSALEEANVKVKNIPVESQIAEILKEISRILPIKIEAKKIKLIIPAVHTGKTYGIINQYKEKEKWLDNGDLEAVVRIPSGIIMDFYDKLNSATQGSILTEEISE